MKIKTFIQHSKGELALEEVEKEIKKIWKEKGNLNKDLKTINIYIKPEESKIYYVINDTVTDSIEIL